jgi:MFS family permease
MSEAIAAARPSPPPVYRWLVLLACSVAMFGCYYVYDGFAPVTPLLVKAFGMTGEQFGWLDTAYNVAALLTLIAGGVLIDRIGMSASAVLFGAIGAAGGLLIAVGPTIVPASPWGSMMAGRFLLGIGSELFIVAATTVVGRWFKGKEISFALAIQLFIARFGTMVADKSPDLAAPLFDTWQKPLLLAAAAGGLWLVFAVLYAVLERSAATRYEVKRAGSTDKLVLADLVKFDLGYWWVVGLCVAFYATIFPFRTFANLYFIEAHGVSEEAAGNLKSVLPIISMIGMPAFGALADRIGKRALLMALGSALLVPPFLMMLAWKSTIMLPQIATPAFWKVPAFVFVSAGTPFVLALSMAMMGLAFALVPAVLWPAVTYLVPDVRLGSAYALMTFCQQFFWALMSPGIGAVKDGMHASAANPAGWNPVMWMLAAMASLAFVFSFLLWKSERGPRSHGLEAVKT